MKSASPEFQNAYIQDALYLDHKLIVEFGNNRFNDGQVITTSGTKVARRGIDSSIASEAVFWKASDVFNNKNRSTMKWLVCDAGAQVNDVEDGTGYRAIHLNNDDTAIEFERGWWSAATSHPSTGVFSTPQWVQSEFFQPDGVTPYVRRSNKVVLFGTEGYAGMKEVTVEYKNEAGSWVALASNIILDEEEFMHIIHDTTDDPNEDDLILSGLRVTIYSTYRPGDWARLSELNAFWIKDISEYVISADVNQIREEYERTVPIGTTAANTLSVELDNSEGLFNTHNGNSIYSPYIGSNCRVEFYLGLDTNQGSDTPEYEYVPMGHFWTDEWEAETGGMTARFNSRDFSKFLQDEMLFWGRVWRNTNVVPVIRDVLLMLGLPLEQIIIDESNLRGYQIIFVEDNSPWKFFGEISFADQGMFGFDEEGNFRYQSYNALNVSPETPPVYTLNWDTNIIHGSTRTQLFVNKITVKVSPYNIGETGIRRIWGPESPTILSWARLASPIGPSDTTITVTQAPRQETGNLTANGWTDTNGYLFLAHRDEELRGGRRFPVISGGELIKYKSRSDNQFFQCERGYWDTVPQSWGAGEYIGEARVWDIEFDNSPAFYVKYPFVTAIDTLIKVPGEEEAQAYVVHWENDAFKARLAIANVAEFYTWLAGTGQTLKDFDNKQFNNDFTFATSVSGEVAVKNAGREARVKIDDIGAENLDYIRRYGKNEIEIENPWIQSAQHAQDIADIMVDEYRYPRKVVDIETILPPTIQLGDRVRISNYPQLDIQNVEYHVIKVLYSYDGSLRTNVTLREVKPN